MSTTESMPDPENKRSAQQWDKNSRKLWANWWDSPVLRHYLNEQICGVPGREDGVAVALSQMPGHPFTRALSIGFGDGAKEIALLAAGTTAKFDLYEISAQQIVKAKAALDERGMGARASFLPVNPLRTNPEPIYDLIYWDHSLHHMFDVRATLEWCKQALGPKGVICINDYVGPTRLQWAKYETVVANAFLAALEKKHSVAIPRISPGNAIKRMRQKMRDPSEAPQSDRIEKACADIFPQFQLRALGGAMLNMCGPAVMGLKYIPEGLLEDFAETDQQCRKVGIYHFAFGTWQAP